MKTGQLVPVPIWVAVLLAGALLACKEVPVFGPGVACGEQTPCRDPLSCVEGRCQLPDAGPIDASSGVDAPSDLEEGAVIDGPEVDGNNQCPTAVSCDAGSDDCGDVGQPCCPMGGCREALVCNQQSKTCQQPCLEECSGDLLITCPDGRSGTPHQRDCGQLTVVNGRGTCTAGQCTIACVDKSLSLCAGDNPGCYQCCNPGGICNDDCSSMCTARKTCEKVLCKHGCGGCPGECTVANDDDCPRAKQPVNLALVSRTGRTFTVSWESPVACMGQNTVFELWRTRGDPNDISSSSFTHFLEKFECAKPHRGTVTDPEEINGFSYVLWQVDNQEKRTPPNGPGSGIYSEPSNPLFIQGP